MGSVKDLDDSWKARKYAKYYRRMHTKKKDGPLWQQLVLGGISGSLATCVTNPLDVIKVRLQLERKKGGGREYQGFLRGSAHLIRTEGILSLGKGLDAAVLRALLYGSVRIGFYEPIRNMISGDQTNASLGIKVSAGFMSGTIAAFIGNPLELIKVRLQAKGCEYPSVFAAFKNIIADEGVSGLWRGIGPTIMRSAFLTGSQMASYDQSKEVLISYLSMTDGPLLHLCAGMISGLVSTTATNPVDVIKTRVMNSRAGEYQQGGNVGERVVYRNALDCTVQTWQKEGMAAFFKGWLPNYVRLGPQTLLILVIYEKLRSLMGWEGL